MKSYAIGHETKRPFAPHFIATITGGGDDQRLEERFQTREEAQRGDRNSQAPRSRDENRMAIKRHSRPRDPIQPGKLIVDIATGQVVDAVDDGKDAAAVEAGRTGGLKGGFSACLGNLR